MLQSQQTESHTVYNIVHTIKYQIVPNDPNQKLTKEMSPATENERKQMEKNTISWSP